MTVSRTRAIRKARKAHFTHESRLRERPGRGLVLALLNRIPLMAFLPINDRFYLWQPGVLLPTARATVRGISPAALVELSRSVLSGLRGAKQYRDADLQIAEHLRAQRSPWVAWRMQRGKGLRGELVMSLLDDALPVPNQWIPGLKERQGNQIILLAAQSLASDASDFILSAGELDCADPAFYARKALGAIAKGLEARGIQLEGVHAVNPKKLEKTCPANWDTRIQLLKASRDQAKAEGMSWRKRHEWG